MCSICAVSTSTFHHVICAVFLCWLFLGFCSSTAPQLQSLCWRRGWFALCTRTYLCRDGTHLTLCITFACLYWTKSWWQVCMTLLWSFDRGIWEHDTTTDHRTKVAVIINTFWLVDFQRAVPRKKLPHLFLLRVQVAVALHPADVIQVSAKCAPGFSKWFWKADIYVPPININKLYKIPTPRHTSRSGTIHVATCYNAAPIHIYSKSITMERSSQAIKHSIRSTTVTCLACVSDCVWSWCVCGRGLDHRWSLRRPPTFRQLHDVQPQLDGGKRGRSLIIHTSTQARVHPASPRIHVRTNARKTQMRGPMRSHHTANLV